MSEDNQNRVVHAVQWRFDPITGEPLSAALVPLTQRPAAQTEREAHEPNAKLMELADRIDHEQLWRLSGLDQMDLPQEKQDRVLAGVMLRRYADLLGNGGWRIFPPRSGASFRASTLDKVVEMARRDEARRASLPAPQQATPTREAREAEQRARMQARFATRHEGKATADFDLPAPNDAPQQATPEPGDDAQIRAIGEGLRSAHDHIEMHRLERSHCKDAERIREGLAAFSAYKKRGDFAATPEPVGEAVYQLQSGDGKWIDQTRASYDYNVKHGNTVRVLYTRPAPGVPEINYSELVKVAAAKDEQWKEGTKPNFAFAKGAEWFRDKVLAMQAKGGAE